MAKSRETTTDYDVNRLGELPDIDLVKKPDWVNLAPLDGVNNDNLLDKLLYKPALRFHGLTGGLWGQGLAGSPSVITDSRPPSYQVKDPLAPRYSTAGPDQGSVYNNNIPALSRVSLRRRNTVAVVLVAAALLTAIAAITGIVLHFIQPKSLLRANVRFTVANENYTHTMMNSSSPDFIKIARPLCGEMDLYYLTSGLADFYLGCNVISLSKAEETNNVAVHYTLDFLDNKVTNDKENIRKVILNKSGRHETNDTLFLVIDEFWVYLRSLKIDLDHVPYEGKPRRPRIPWRNDLDFITRESNAMDVDYNSVFVPLQKYSSNVVLTTSFTNSPFVPRHVLPGINHELPRINNHAINIALPFTDARKALVIPSNVLPRQHISVLTQDHNKLLLGTFKRHTVQQIRPTKSHYSTLYRTESKVIKYPFDQKQFDEDEANHLNEKGGHMQHNLLDNTNLIDEIPTSLPYTYPILKRNPIFIDTSFKMTPSMTSDRLTDGLFPYIDEQRGSSENIEENSVSSKRVLAIDSDVFLIGGADKTAATHLQYTSQLIPEEISHNIDNTIKSPETVVDILPKIPSDTSTSTRIILDAMRYPYTNNLHSTNGHVYAFKSKTVKGILPSVFDDYSQTETIYSVVISTSSIHTSVAVQSSLAFLGPEIELNEMFMEDAVQISVPSKERIKSNDEDLSMNEITPEDEAIDWINVLNVPIIPDKDSILAQNTKNSSSGPSGLQRRSKHTIDDIIREFFPSNIYLRRHENITKDHSSHVLFPESSSNSHMPTSYEPNHIPPSIDVPYSGIVIDDLNENIFYNISSWSDSRQKTKYFHPQAAHQVRPTDHVTSQSTSSAYRPSLQYVWTNDDPNNGRQQPSFTKQLRRRFMHSLTNRRINGFRNLENNKIVNYNHFDNRLFKPRTVLRENSAYLHDRRVDLNIKSQWNNRNIPRKEIRDDGHLPLSNKKPKQFREKQFIVTDRYNNIKIFWWIPTDYSVTYGDYKPFQSDLSSFATLNYYYRPVNNLFVPHNKDPYVQPYSNERAYSKAKQHYTTLDMQHPGTVVNQAQRLFQPNNAGFTKSYNVSDIYEMKNILKQLIDAMQNMSHKIDKMQVAINLINQTLHETKQPMHRLEHTFENMTKSFDNFNRNLNDIRDVLSDFKNFLKPFDQTIFNVDDIINHIDKTVDNLEKTRQFVGVSMNDLGETVKDVTGSLFDLNSSLSHVNMSVFHVNNTAMYTNRTLDSMGKTLESLDWAIRNMNRKIDKVFGGIDGINVSLTTINSTIKSSQDRLSKLQNRISSMNSTMKRIEDTVIKHNKTYQNIMQTLENMNEPMMITKGTVLEVIDQLGNVDDELLNISSHIGQVDDELDLINGSLVSTLQWMKHMFHALEKFNVSVDTVDNDITFNLNSIDIVDAVGILLKINSTLHTVGRSIDLNDINIDAAEGTLNHLELNLNQLDKLLSTINNTFTSLNNTLKGLNSTLVDIQQPLNAIDDNVNRVEHSFKDLNETFDNIDKTLDIANQTLRKVDTTTRDIDTRLNQISHSLNHTQKSVVLFNNSVSSLNSSFNTIEGPLIKLNEDLNNRNETLRVMKMKLNSTISSFDILKENLQGINVTFDEILTKLNETADALDRTNNSLNDVSLTITAIEDINEEMNTMLNNLYTLFNSTQESLIKFGSAFPSLQEKMSETEYTIIEANNQIKQINKSLYETYKKRQNSTTSYLNVRKFMKDVYKHVINEREDLFDALEFANDVENDIIFLRKTVESTDKNHNRLNRNVDLLNQVFPTLKDEFEFIETDSERHNRESFDKDKMLNSLKSAYEEIVSKVDNYSSVLFPDDIYLKIENMTETLDLVNKHKDMWDVKVKNASKNVWNDKGNPINLHGNYDDILKNTNNLNQTMHDFSTFMADVSKIVDDISTANKTIIDKFKHINETFEKLDSINALEKNIEKDVTDIELELAKDNAELKTAEQLLRNKIKKFENIKRQYGDIHGTLNSSEIYGDIDELLETMEAHMRALVSNSRNASHLFHESRLKYDLTNHAFQATPVTIDSNGDSHMGDTFNSLVLVDKTLDSVYDEISSVNKNSKKLFDYIDQLDNHTKNLIDLLQNKTNSFDFVKTNRPALVSSFEELDILFQNISYQFQSLYSRFENINSMATEISILSKDISNVDMSLAEDTRLLSNLYDTVNKFETELDAGLSMYNSALKEFKSFDSAPQSYETLKDEYAKYERILNNLKKTAVTTEIEMSVINRRLDDIVQYFERDINSLEKYISSKTTLNSIISDFKTLSEKFNETESTLDMKNADVQDISNQLETLKESFSNFTAASLNISNIYINVEVKQLITEFENIVEEFSLLRNEENNLKLKLEDLFQTLTFAPFTRFNIMRVLDNDIIPEAGRVEIGIDNLSSAIHELRSRLDEISTEIMFLNESLQSTEDRLSIDKQKKLIADMKFPHLHQSMSDLNDLLHTLNASLNYPNELLKTSNDSLNNVFDKLDSLPTLQLSDKEYKKDINSLAETIKNINSEINHVAGLLSDTNETIWVGNGSRYLHNESINDIRKRYSNAMETLAVAHEKVNDITKHISLTNNSLLNTSNDINSLNSSVELFKNLAVNISKVFNLIDSTEDDLQNSKYEIFDSSKKLTYLDTKFNDTSVRFVAMDNNKLDKELGHVEKNVSLSKNYLNSILKEYKVLDDTFDTLKHNLRHLNGTKYETISDELVLNKINVIVTKSLENISAELNMTHLQNKQLVLKLDPLNDQIDSTNSSLDNAIDNLLKQEKIDFYKSSFKKDLYDEVGRRLEDIYFKNENLMGLLNIADSTFQKLRKSNKSNENVNISLENESNMIDSLNRTYKHNAWGIEKMRETHANTYNLFFTEDGLEISDGENIDELKERFNKLTSTLMNINNYIRPIDDSLGKKVFDDLEKQTGDMVKMTRVIEKLRSYADMLKEFDDRSHYVETVLQTAQTKLGGAHGKVDLFNDEMDKYESEFTGVENFIITAKKEKITQLLSELELSLKSTSIKTKNDENDYRLMKTLISEKLIRNEIGFNTLMEIESYLNDSTEAKAFIQKYLLNVDQSLLSSINELKEDNVIIDSVRNEIDSLKRLLLHQEKIDYINENAPSLVHKLQSLNDTSNNIIENVLAARNDISLVNNFKNLLQNRLLKTDKVLISLTNISNALNTTEKIIGHEENAVSTLQLDINNIDKSLFNKDSIVIYSDLDAIQRNYQDVNKTLNDGEVISMKASNKISNVDEQIADIKDYLRDIYKELRNHDELKSRFDLLENDNKRVKENIVNVTIQSENIQTEVENIESSLSNLQKRFSDVDNPFLRQEITNLLADTKDLLQSSVNSLTNLENIKDIKRKSDMYIDRLKDAYNGTQHSNEDLKLLNMFANGTVENINTTLDDLTDEIRAFENELSNNQNKVNVISNRLGDLETMLFHNQKEKYVNETLPQIFVEVESYEKLLEKLLNDIEHASVIYLNTTNEMQNTKLNAENNGIDLIFNDLNPNKFDMKMKLAEASDKYKKMKDNLKSFVEAINSQVDTKDTFTDIENRLRRYNESIGLLVHNTLPIFNITNDIKTISQTSLSLVDDYNNLLQKLLETRTNLQKQASSVDNITVTGKTLSDKLLKTKQDIYHLHKKLDYIGDRYTSVNSSYLANMKSMINTTLTELNNKQLEYENRFNNELSTVLDTATNKLHLAEMTNLTTVDNVAEMQKHTMNLKETIEDVEGQLNLLKGEFAVLSNETIPEHEQIISGTRKSISKLMSNYEDENKNDYIQEHLPEILSAYFAINQSLSKQKNSIDEVEVNVAFVNNSIDEIENRLVNISNLFLSLHDHKLDIKSGKQNIDYLSSILESKKDKLREIDIKELSPEYLKSTLLTDIKTLFANIRNTLNETTDTLEFTNNKIRILNESTGANDKSLKNINDLLDRFLNLRNMSIDTNDKLLSVYHSITNTSKTLKSVDDHLRDKLTRLERLKEAYPNITSEAIQNLYDTAKKHINLVEMRLPLVNELFETKSIPGFNLLNKSHNAVQNDLMSQFIPDRNSLQNVVDTSEIMLSNISKQMKHLKSNDFHYRDDALQLYKHVTNFDSILDELEQSLITQTKRNLINSKIPILKKRLHKIKNATLQEDNNLFDLEKKWDLLNKTYQYLQTEINDEPSLDISMNSKYIDLNRTRNGISDLSNVIIGVFHDIDEIPIFNISFNEIILNDNYSIADVEDTISNIERPLKTLSMAINDINKNSSEISNIFSVLTNFSQTFKEKLKEYSLIEDKMVNFTAAFNDILSKQNSADTRLVIAKETIDNLKSDIRRTIAEFKDYNPDDSYIQYTIREAEKELIKLDKRFEIVSSKLLTVNDTFFVMNNSLHISKTNVDELTETIRSINTSHADASTALLGINDTLDSIIKETQVLDITLDKAKDDIIDFNRSLVTEDKKTHYIKTTLPVLKKKYKETQFSFNVLNKTFDEMEDKLIKLEDFVSNIKSKMEQFKNINISMANITTNLTDMESRLLNMQDHYDNIKEIVLNLKNDLNKTSNIGKDVSFENVTYMFNSYNLSIDKVDMVLGKIDMEFTEMDDQFASINDTLLELDTALEEYAHSDIETNVLNDEISEISHLLHEKDTRLLDMKKRVQELNGTFEDLQSIFKDVVNSTASKNLIFKDKLFNASNLISKVKDVLLKKLKNNHIGVEDKFIDMNRTLKENISTSSELNDLLSKVQLSQEELANSLDAIKDGMGTANNHTDDLQSLLGNVADLLSEINSTLQSEQAKHDFIKKNMMSFEDQLLEIQGKFVLAKESLNNTDIYVNDTSLNLNTLQNRLLLNKRANFSIDEKPLNAIQKALLSLASKYLSLNSTFVNLKTNISNADDTNSDITELSSRYTNINKTMYSLHEGLDTMISSISYEHRQTGPIVEHLHIVDSHLDRFDIAIYKTENIENNITDIEESTVSVDSNTSAISTILDNIDEDLIIMSKVYENVNTAKSKSVKFQLQELVKEFIEMRSSFESINETLDLFKDNLLLANNDSLYLEIYLKTNFPTFDKLRTALNSSENVISNILLKIGDLKIDLKTLQENSTNMLNDVVDLRERIKTLNASLFEEMSIEQYIANNYGQLDMKYNMIKSRMDKANVSIFEAFKRTTDLNDYLGKLTRKLDRFSAINMSLESDQNSIEDERRQLEQLMALFKNVSDSHSKLPLIDMKNTNKTFADVRADYADFENALQRLTDHLNHTDITVIDTNSRLDALNSTLLDINETADNYEKMENIISDQVDQSINANTALDHTKDVAIELEKQIKFLNESLRGLENSFKQINDPSLEAAKNELEQLLKLFTDQLNGLKNSNNEIEELSTVLQDRLGSINDTLYSTKVMIGQLKDHIANVNKSSVLVEDDLKNMKSKQKIANNTATDLKPKLDQVFKDLENLTLSFNREQQKLDFLEREKPVLQAEYESLEAQLSYINKRISMTDFQLADLKYAIKTTDSQLDKLKTLNITTNPEMIRWTDHYDRINDLSSRFLRISSAYNLLQDDIQQLDRKNKTEEELKTKIQSIKDSLNDTKQALMRKNETLKVIEKDISDIESILEVFDKTMKDFRVLQVNGTLTKELMDRSLESISNITKAVDEITALNNIILESIDYIKTKYKSISNKSWLQKLSSYKQITTKEANKLKVNRSNLRDIDQVMKTTTAAFNKTYSNLKNEILDRDSVRVAMQKMDRGIRSASGTFVDTGVEISNLDKSLNSINTTFLDTLTKINQLNATLHLEWQKATYVNNHLPILQDKLVSVNETFTKNIPSSRELKSQIAYLTILLEKIEDKMIAYSIDDTDNSVREWRNDIGNLNRTVRDIINQNEQSDQVLTDLRSKLWSDRPMYTKPETLTDVKVRFSDFNRTLDEIETEAVSINLLLGNLDSNTTRMAVDMENKDLALTTTTTPAAAPDWLSFTSSGSGVIAQDKGYLECSAKDLTSWEIMKITRVHPDGTEQDMAAWKVGMGARKPRTLRDRRIRAKRVLDGAGGGKLQINITSVQCVDEAKYFCSIDSHSMWPLKADINVINPPEDSLEPEFPTEVFEDKVANFSCTGHPGYPNGRIIWKIRRANEAFFKDFDFYSARSKVVDEKCTRTETNTVGYQFDMHWNSTRIRCYIEGTDYYGEGIIRILPYSICNKVRDLGKIRHPYTPHKYIVCDRGLNIMQCPGKTCYDQAEGNCVQCKASDTGGDPCRGQPPFSFVAHETDCKKYYICMGNTKSIKRCAKGYFSSAVRGACTLTYAQSDCAKKKG